MNRQLLAELEEHFEDVEIDEEKSDAARSSHNFRNKMAQAYVRELYEECKEADVTQSREATFVLRYVFQLHKEKSGRNEKSIQCKRNKQA